MRKKITEFEFDKIVFNAQLNEAVESLTVEPSQTSLIEKKPDYKPLLRKILDENTGELVFNEKLKRFAGNGKFNYTEKNKKLIGNLYKYFTDDNTSEFDLKRGILLVGNTGNGKTSIFKAFKQFTLQHFVNKTYNMLSAQELAINYTNYGMNAISENSYRTSNEYYGKFERVTNLCIDDIGTTSNLLIYYGNIINIIEEIYTHRYEIWKSTGHVTHASLNDIDIINNYNARVVERIKEMSNIIMFNDETFRKNKIISIK